MRKQMKWVKLAFFSLVFLIASGVLIKDYRSSRVVGHSEYRFNMAMITPGDSITFVSYDPKEKAILALPFPSNLAINSRGSGEYKVASLYKLGSYTGEGGEFARQKVQGFMRVPVPGYIVNNQKARKPKSQVMRSLALRIFSLRKSESSITRLDAMFLLYRSGRYSWRVVSEDELLRAGVIADNIYHPERMQEFVGSRLFDWGIGSTGVSVAIINESGENGLGSDMAEFLSNLGMDVVMVRSSTNNEYSDTTRLVIDPSANARDLTFIFGNLFGLKSPKIETVPAEYRAKVLLRVGKDAKELF